MRSPISLAAGLGAALLLAATPVQAQDAQSALWDAAISGDTTEIVKALDAGAKIDSLDTRRSQNGRRPLNWAALANSAPAVRVLLARGAPIDAQNLTGFTALHHAAEAGSVETAEALIAAGAKLDIANRHGMAAVEVARDQGHTAVVDLLERAAARAR
jgi:ankyrin repeat protein